MSIRCWPRINFPNHRRTVNQRSRSQKCLEVGFVWLKVECIQMQFLKWSLSFFIPKRGVNKKLFHFTAVRWTRNREDASLTHLMGTQFLSLYALLSDLAPDSFCPKRRNARILLVRNTAPTKRLIITTIKVMQKVPRIYNSPLGFSIQKGSTGIKK